LELADKYKDHGLVVIGVHAPEFSFEKNVDNVRWAAKDMRIEYPIVIDNDHAIWRTFNNRSQVSDFSANQTLLHDGLARHEIS
jgi:hypothetical protein